MPSNGIKTMRKSVEWARYFRSCRIEKQMRKNQVAHYACVSPTYVYHIEVSGVIPSQDICQRLCRVLDLDPIKVQELTEHLMLNTVDALNALDHEHENTLRGLAPELKAAALEAAALDKSDQWLCSIFLKGVLASVKKI